MNVEACMQAFIRVKVMTTRFWELKNLICRDENFKNKQSQCLDANQQQELTSIIARNKEEKVFTENMLKESKLTLEVYFNDI